MSLQFVLGSSGSGKTENTYRMIVKEAGENPLRNYLILVPEQFTLQTQQKLVELAPSHAIMNIDVLSFKRLAYRVFDDLGMNTTEILEETGKNLVLRKVAQEHAQELVTLGSHMNRLGYVNDVKSLISELLQYNVSPEQLEEYSKHPGVSSAFAGKLKDIVTMYRGFRSFMQDRYITAEELLHLLIPVVGQSELLRDSVLVFDEFTGFTPIQNRLLQVVMPCVSRMYVLLALDRKENLTTPVREHELFAMTKKTMAQLTAMAQQENIPVEDAIIYGDSADRRFAQAPDLAHLEQHLFRPWIRKWAGEAEHLHLASCLNPKEELLYTVREIARLVRTEGYRYREIAVVTGSVESYRPYAEDLFARYDIPYFLDQTSEIVFHPFIECIRAIPEVITEDFSYPSVMRFLRSGFSGFADEEIDRLDNYLLAIGGRGRRFWEKKWLHKQKSLTEEDLSALEALRSRIYQLFTPILSVLDKNRARTELLIRGFYEIMQQLDMEQALTRRAEEEAARGEQIRAKEDGQLYRIVMQLLEKWYALLGSDRISMEEFSDLLDAGLSAAQVAAIPPGFDSVTIGDIERTRLNHVKILFFVGVNDGVIPKSTASGGIISEFERELMQEAQIPLAPGAREQTFIQRFYLYRNLTKPSEGLYLSWARVDAQGKALRPSYLIDTIRQLFPDIRPAAVADVTKQLNASTPAAAMDYLINGEEDDRWFALAGCLLDTELSGETRQLLLARFIDGLVDPISRVIADALYGHSLELSVTRIERFAQCAYAHFLRYGLELSPRQESGFENVDIGNLYHRALYLYGSELDRQGKTWTGLSEQERETRAGEAMQKAILEYPNLTAFSTAADQRKTERMQRIFLQTVWALTEQLRAGSFRPSAYELHFHEVGNPQEMEMLLDQEHLMKLRGTIDRLDTCRSDGEVYVKIIDYKSGKTNFQLTQVYLGTMLQLVVYADAALSHVSKEQRGKAVPGAILYYHIDDPVITLASGEEISEAELKDMLLLQLRPDGLVNEAPQVIDALDHDLAGKSKVIPVTYTKNGVPSKNGSHIASAETFAILQEYVKNFLKDSGRKIYEGDISINPIESPENDSCRYCDYAGICGIHAGFAGVKKRRIPKLSSKDIIGMMETENALHRNRGEEER